MDGGEVYHGGSPSYAVPTTPAGLEAIYKCCRRLYPTQPNPLQVTAVVKYWLGGPDPLDYISMYANPGDPTRGIPAHWHYISFGLSDLHGDGRVHQNSRGTDGASGFGFELSFRLKREDGETGPPTWPAALMQALARYVFQSENTLCAGDHVSWHQPLDGSESRIQHMVMMEDPQLHAINTAFGLVSFVQIVGVCAEELKAAQHWNGPGVIDLLKKSSMAGGSWLITDMRRGETIFEIDPQLQETVDAGIEEEGSNLSGVSGRCSWEENTDLYEDNEEEEDKENRDAHRRSSTLSSDSETKPHLSPTESEQIKATLKKGLSYNTKPVLPPIKSTSGHHEFRDSTSLSQRSERKPSVDSEGPSELLRTRILDSVHLKFNLEAGSLLPLALRGRLRHGRHFTYKSVLNDVAITLVSTSVLGSIADEQHPFATHGPWLQVLFTDDFIEQLLEELSDLASFDEISEPLVYHWPERKLTITVVPDDA